MKKTGEFVMAGLVALVLGSVIGVATAIWGCDLAMGATSIRNGAWETNLTVGSVGTDPYTRATTAIHFLLALNQSETLYYGAYRDDDGNLLNGKYTYRIEGGPLDARWWSITAYGADDFLIPNDLDRYSYNMGNLAYGPDGRYVIYLSQEPHEGNWLPLGGLRSFSLTLRLYNPKSSVRDNPAGVQLPHIVKEAGK